ncbi:MAG: hypothetical protein JXR51_07850 [Bacteroidales bacterium]|nr:hypothetical protein [Bacteroidales bacterium]MBN2757073.1 hypothetical protein [Bacteroidales bacterium]
MFFHINSIAQFSLDNNAGFSLGINFSFGTHINKIGLFTKAYIFKDFTQINIASSYFFNFTGFEKKRKYAEFQQNIGILFSYGDSVKSKNLFLSPVSNQTSKKYSFAYSYNIYRNKIETSQQTGTIAFGIDNWQIISENDIFAVPASDKFRTASILIKYNYKNYSFGINSTLWTGNPKKAKTVKDTIFKSRFGYKDMSNSPYGKTSSGILAFETEYALPYYQSLKFSAGIDSEKIRNILQNKIIHDMYFVPKKLNKAQNPHMPMIAEDGNLYLYKKIQKIRKSKLYLKISANDMIFY